LVPGRRYSTSAEVKPAPGFDPMRWSQRRRRPAKGRVPEEPENSERGKFRSGGAATTRSRRAAHRLPALVEFEDVHSAPDEMKRGSRSESRTLSAERVSEASPDEGISLEHLARAAGVIRFHFARG